MTKDRDTPSEVEQLAALATRFSSLGYFEPAADLLAVAERFDPKNRAVRLGLAELRKQQQLNSGTKPRSQREGIREQFRRDRIDAAHFLGLAYVYADKGENLEALQCVAVSEAKDPGNPGPYKLRGKILFRRESFEGAARELSRALRYNPFDQDTAELLGKACYELRNHEEALAATIQAFLLLHDANREAADRLRRRIRTLKQILGIGTRELTETFRQGQETLRIAFDRLAWHRERFFDGEGVLHAGLFAPPEPPKETGAGRIERAALLRLVPLFSHFSDEQLFLLTRAVRQETFESNQQVLATGDSGRDLFIVEEGDIVIRRETPYGNYDLGRLGAGDLFGEANFMSPFERSGEVWTLTRCTFLRFDAVELESLEATQPELGVQLYWALWHAVARKLRATNEQLRAFFGGGERPENAVVLERVRVAEKERSGATVAQGDKVRLFREKGLSGSELATLTTFSRERHYAADAYLFQEGDEGDEMYIILDGKVRISKYIEGGGEEALAILHRGDFFGEMTLIDGQPRSADARAHGGEVTVLTLDSATVHEVLTMDAQASLEFLKLLCRLISQRLREIDEKVVGWHILSGGGMASDLGQLG